MKKHNFKDSSSKKANLKLNLDSKTLVFGIKVLELLHKFLKVIETALKITDQ